MTTTTPTRTSREFRLAARPVGEPHPSDLELVTTAVPDLADGQILVRNTWMSVDPYMRGRMDDAPSYIEPFALGEPLEGSALGEVVASRAPQVSVGATVRHFLGWRESSRRAHRTRDVETVAATRYDVEHALQMQAPASARARALPLSAVSSLTGRP
jgi:NADPH-dependent curcumin reductase CurA